MEAAFTLTVCAIVIVTALSLRPADFGVAASTIYLAGCGMGAFALAVFNLDIMAKIAGAGPDEKA